MKLEVISIDPTSHSVFVRLDGRFFHLKIGESITLEKEKDTSEHEVPR